MIYTERGASIMLGRLYRQLNRDAYGDRLPLAKFLFSSDRGMSGTLAHTMMMADDNGDVRPPIFIRFHRRLLFSRKLLVRELIHEMVHIAHPTWQHGRRFGAEMFRVSRRGLASCPWGG